jgi:hypothetical protein
VVDETVTDGDAPTTVAEAASSPVMMLARMTD